MKTLFKKSLLVLMVAFIAVFTLGVSSKVKAAESTYTYTFTAKTYSANNQTKTLSNVDWALTGTNGNYWGYDATKGQQFGAGKAASYYSAMTLTSETFNNVSSIKINTSGASSTNAKLVIYVGDIQVGTKSLTSTASTYTFTVDDLSGAVKFSYTQTSYKAIYIKSIEITYSNEVSNEPSISLSGDTFTEVDDVVTLNAELANVTGTVEWSSSNSNVATVDQNGNVTAISMGTTTITATVGDVSDTHVFTVFPTGGSELTIAEALEVCKLTGETNCAFKYSVSGTIESIDDAYNSEYKNISVTITDGTNSIKAYRMKEGAELLVGQQIKVTGTLVNYSGKTPEFIAGCTYEAIVDDTTSDILEALNDIKAYMSLAYKYTCVEKEVAVTTEVSDILDLDLTGVSGTNYVAWSGKTVTTNAVWAGQSAGGNDSIQLRSNNSNSGVVTTASGGKVSKIIITWNSNTTNGRTLDVYGSNTAYTKPTELYSSATQGEKLGSIVYGTSTELEISGDYAYIGLRSNSGAMYITSIEVVWAVEGEGTTTEMGYDDVDFRIKCGVDKALADIEGVDSYGIRVSTSEKSLPLASTGNDDLCLFAVVSLGDALTNAQRLDVVFTVQAYVVIEGVTYVSELTKSYSVREMVEEYYANPETTDLVASLYELIQK